MARIIPATTVRTFCATPVGQPAEMRCPAHPKRRFGLYRTARPWGIRGIRGLPQCIVVWDRRRDLWVCGATDEKTLQWSTAIEFTDVPLDEWPDETPVAWIGPECYCG